MKKLAFIVIIFILSYNSNIVEGKMLSAFSKRMVPSQQEKVIFFTAKVIAEQGAKVFDSSLKRQIYLGAKNALFKVVARRGVYFKIVLPFRLGYIHKKDVMIFKNAGLITLPEEPMPLKPVAVGKKLNDAKTKFVPIAQKVKPGPKKTNPTQVKENLDVLTDGTVIENKVINGNLRIYASNVVIRNCKIIGNEGFGIKINKGAKNIKIENTQIGSRDKPILVGIINESDGEIDVTTNGFVNVKEPVLIKPRSVHKTGQGKKPVKKSFEVSSPEKKGSSQPAKPVTPRVPPSPPKKPERKVPKFPQPRRNVRFIWPNWVKYRISESRIANVERWRRLVEKYFPADRVEEALYVINGESGGNPRAVNRTSGAAGLFQHMPQYWAARAANAGFPGASIFDPEANIAASALLVKGSLSRGRDAWSHWSVKPPSSRR